VGYIFALHVPIAGMTLFPVLLNWPLALLPLHVVFLELVTDPACSIAFEAEPEEKDVMMKPPLDRNQPLLTPKRGVMSLLEGGSILLVVLGVYWVSLRAGRGADYSRALAFAALIAGNLMLMLSSRSSTRPFFERHRTPNRSLRWIILITAVSLGLVLYAPALRPFFQFSAVRPMHLMEAVFAGAASLAWFEALKRWRTKGRAAVESH